MNTTVEEMHMENDRKVGEVFRTMLIFTFFMVLAPISTYFWSKSYIFEKRFNFNSDESYIYAAISAVVVVHVILGAYIYIAWKDASSEQDKKKKQ